MVVTAIRKPNRRFNELRWIDAVESSQLDRDVVTADLLYVSTCERAHAAVSAKEVMPGPRAELVIAQIVLAGDQAECARLAPP